MYYLKITVAKGVRVSARNKTRKLAICGSYTHLRFFSSVLDEICRNGVSNWTICAGGGDKISTGSVPSRNVYAKGYVFRLGVKPTNTGCVPRTYTIVGIIINPALILRWQYFTQIPEQDVARIERYFKRLVH